MSLRACMGKKALASLQRGFAPVSDGVKHATCRKCERTVTLKAGSSIAKCAWCGLAWDTKDGLVHAQRGEAQC